MMAVVFRFTHTSIRNNESLSIQTLIQEQDINSDELEVKHTDRTLIIIHSLDYDGPHTGRQIKHLIISSFSSKSSKCWPETSKNKQR